MKKKWSFVLKVFRQNFSSLALPTDLEAMKMCILDDTRGVLRLRGKDVYNFLQGIVTNNVHQLSDQRGVSLYAAMLTPKGRMIHDLIIYNDEAAPGEAAVLLDSDRRTVTDLVNELKKYRLRSEVEVEDVSSSYSVCCAFGTTRISDMTRSDPRLTSLGYRFVLPSDQIPRSDLASQEAYREWRIQHGVAENRSEIPADSLPLEYNLEGLNGVSFVKGCYVGQELTARTHYQGTIRKRIMPVTLRPIPSFNPEGLDVYIQPDGRSIGQIRASSKSSALAFLRVHPALEAHAKGTSCDSSVVAGGLDGVLKLKRQLSQTAPNCLVMAEATESHRQNLEDELRRVKATVESLDTQITSLKAQSSWDTTLAQNASNDAQLQLWRTILLRSPVADAYRDYAPTRAKAKKTRVRGRTADPIPIAASKRTRMLSTKEKRIESIWSQCSSILSAIKKHKYAWPFLQPVDAEALNIPDYYEVVKHPMDLGTITKKLEQDVRKGRYRQYKTPMEFRDDVRQVWINCKTYNKPGQDVRIMGDNISELWEKKWCHAEIESKWEAEIENQSEDQAMIEDEHGWQTQAVAKKKTGRGSMSFLDRRKLAQQIGMLNEEQVAVITDLLHSMNVSEEEGEMVLDLEKMDSQKLWTIKNKVDAITAKIKRTPIQT